MVDVSESLSVNCKLLEPSMSNSTLHIECLAYFWHYCRTITSPRCYSLSISVTGLWPKLHVVITNSPNVFPIQFIDQVKINGDQIWSPAWHTEITDKYTGSLRQQASPVTAWEYFCRWSSWAFERGTHTELSGLPEKIKQGGHGRSNE